MSPGPNLHHHLCLLDVGHGNCTVLIDGDRNVAVVDVGKQSALSMFLEEQQITHIRSVYLSHADEDHIGALVGLLGSAHISIDRVFLNSDAEKTSKLWDDLLYELSAANRVGSLVVMPSLSAGHTEQLTGRLRLDVLGPSPYLAGKGPGSTDRHGRRIRSNSISAVIAVSVNGCRLALLPADLDATGLQDLLENKADLAAPILVYPHHGGLPGNDPTTFANALLAETRPDRVVFSIGRGRYATPNPRTVDAVCAELPDARIICTQLSEHCSDVCPASSVATHLSSAFAQGRLGGTCCGGSIVVPLDSLESLEPGPSDHASFIRSHVPTPLCLRALPSSASSAPGV